MGQKTHPVGFRLGITRQALSRWYASAKDMPGLLAEDRLIRDYIQKRLGHAAIAEVHIERKPGKVTVTIHTGRPGVVIGKRGAEVDKLREELAVVLERCPGPHLVGRQRELAHQRGLGAADRRAVEQ